MVNPVCTDWSFEQCVLQRTCSLVQSTHCSCCVLVCACRLHQLRCALEAVSILVHLPPSLLDPLTAPKLSALTNLLLSALQAATVAVCTLSSLGGTKVPGGAKPASSGLAGTFLHYLLHL